MEAAGIEPASEIIRQSASTCLADVFFSHPPGPIGRTWKMPVRMCFRLPSSKPRR